MNKMHSDYSLNLISKLTLEEKIALVSGHNFMFTNAVPRLNIPSIRMSDGPHGLRIQSDEEAGIKAVSSSTCFPTAATTSNSWNPSLLKEMGKAMAEEARFYGIDIILGPGVNIKRNPLCGRNFEYFSEDPLLAGVLGAAEVNGIQSEGVGTSLKHFAFNNEENHRYMCDAVVDMRAAHDIYLKPFEYIIKNAHPETVMNAYNKVNGEYCTESKWLLTDVLRNEFDFDGLIMTDWGATHNRVEGIKTGNDLEMPGDTLICRKWLFDAVKNGTLNEKELDERVLNVLDLVSKHLNKNKLEKVDWDAHHELAKTIAEESAVLLKNDRSLPLNKEEKICVIGELFEKMRYQGSGSSMITPHKLTTCKDAFDLNEVNYVYFKGYKQNDSKQTKSLIKEAVEGSKEFEKVIVFIGLTDFEESEGGDRKNMSLPTNQLVLLETLIKANKKIVVVLYGGSVVELPFYDKVSSILNMFLPGQNGGTATFDLLFGKKNPCGKLSETWPLKYSDVLFNDEFGKQKQLVYKESVYVGYRYYLTAKKEVRFPFGYGLSYTAFVYSDFDVKENGENIKITLKVKNVGSYEGNEIVQAYISGPDSDFFKPLRELKGFTKVNLKPNESKQVEITLNKEDLKSWNIKEGKRSLEEGYYSIQVGKNSNEIVFEKSIYIKGEDLSEIYAKNPGIPYKNLSFDQINNEVFEAMSGMKIPEIPKLKPITIESRLPELKQTLIGRILFNFIIGVAKKEMRKAKKMPEGTDRDNAMKAALAMKMMMETNNPLGMTMAAANQFPYNSAEGLVELSNWHLIKGIKKFKHKIEAPKLPIENQVKSKK